MLLPSEDISNHQLENQLEVLFDLVKLYIQTIRTDRPKAIIRIFFPDFHEVLLAKCSNNNVGHIITRFLMKLKRYIYDSRTLVIFSVNPKVLLSTNIMNILQYNIDTVLGIESFTGRQHCVPYEFDRFHGFLVLYKIQQMGMLAPYKPSSSRYGIIRDRRKVNIEPLHLPPEESRAFPSSNSSNSSSVSDRNMSIAQAIGGGCSSISTTSTSSHTVISQSKISTISKVKNLEYEVDHNHSHNHDHNCKEDSCDSSVGSNVAGPVKGPITISSSTVASSVGTNKSSLASSLAAARAARQSGKASSSSVKPSATSVQNNNIDF
jgi:hypothetical protein